MMATLPLSTTEGRKARELAGLIAETGDVGLWRDLMALYSSTSSPTAKSEVIRIAASFVGAAENFLDSATVTSWRLELNGKVLDQQQRGQL